MTRGLDSIFKPNSVAVVGASTNPEKLGYQILENIINGGFEGKIYPLNPKATDILGLNCINDPADLPEGVDLAVMIIPAGYHHHGGVRRVGRGRGKAAKAGGGDIGAEKYQGHRPELSGGKLRLSQSLRFVAPDNAERGHGDRIAERNRRGGPDRLGFGGKNWIFRFRKHGEQSGC
ncbi:MAG: CoA-binding protein [Planctomycetota bacterium]